MFMDLDCTAAQLRTSAKSSQCRLVHHLALACAPGRSPRIVELIALTKAADAAHRRHALVPGAEAAIRGTARAAAVDGAPRIRIVGREPAGVCANTVVDKASVASTIVRMRIASLLLWLCSRQRSTSQITFYFMRCGQRARHVSKAREPRPNVGRDCGAVQPVASDYRTDWARRTRRCRSRLLCTAQL